MQDLENKFDLTNVQCDFVADHDLKYIDNQYICDVISEWCDGYIPVYTYDIKQEAIELDSDYLNQAIQEFECRDFTQICKTGLFLSYQADLNDNLNCVIQALIYKYLVDNEKDPENYDLEDIATKWIDKDKINLSDIED